MGVPRADRAQERWDVPQRREATALERVPDEPEDVEGCQPLSPREQVFADCLVAHGSRSRAARAAGYNAAGARAAAMKLLARPHVAAYVAAQLAEKRERLKLESERVIDELMIVAGSSLDNYEVDREGFVTVRPGAPEESIRAVKKLKRTVRYVKRRLSDKEDPEGPDEFDPEVTVELQLHDKVTAANTLIDVLGLRKNVNINVNGTLEDFLRERAAATGMAEPAQPTQRQLPPAARRAAPVDPDDAE